MRTVISNWPIVMLRGVLALILAGFAYSAQGFSTTEWFELLWIAFIVVGLCAYGIFDGILLMWFALRSPGGMLRRFGITEGIGSIVLAIVLATLLFVKVSTVWFVVLAVGQCWLMAFNEITIARHLSRHVADRRGFSGAGIISLLFGAIAAVANDGTGYKAAVWLTWYGAMMAVTHFWIAYRMHSWHSEAHRHAAAAA